MAAPHRARRLLRHPEKEAWADAGRSQRGTRPRLPHRRTGERMKPPIHNASARQSSGGPSPVPGRSGNWTNRAGSKDTAEVEREIAELGDRSTHELRLAWRALH